MITFKALHGLTPSYLATLISLPVSTRALRSADQMVLKVPLTRLKLKGDRAFSVAAPRLWNTLPLAVRTAPTMTGFKSKLKTHLFSLAFQLPI